MPPCSLPTYEYGTPFVPRQVPCSTRRPATSQRSRAVQWAVQTQTLTPLWVEEQQEQQQQEEEEEELTP